LTRFGYTWFARPCANHGCELLVLNNEQLSPEREMVEDLMTIVDCFSARLYGLRNYKKTLTTALNAGHGAQKISASAYPRLAESFRLSRFALASTASWKRSVDNHIVLDTQCYAVRTDAKARCGSMSRA
jgi:hypothetical protein